MKNQGRSDKQMESNYKIAFISLLGLLVTFIYIVLKSNL